VTPFAKMLIFLNVILSLFFTGWAAALYTNREEWAPPRSLFGEPLQDGPPGINAELEKQIDQLVARRDLAEEMWQEERRKLRAVAEHREKYLAWYPDMLAAPESGKDRTGTRDIPDPVRRLILAPGKEFYMKDDIDMAKGEPVTVGGEAVKPYATYEAELAEVAKGLDDIQKTLNDQAAEHKQLTERIVGIHGKTRGLQAERDIQRSYMQNCIDERDYLRPLVENSEAELYLLKRRHAALTARLKELEEFTDGR